MLIGWMLKEATTMVTTSVLEVRGMIAEGDMVNLSRCSLCGVGGCYSARDIEIDGVSLFKSLNFFFEGKLTDCGHLHEGDLVEPSSTSLRYLICDYPQTDSFDALLAKMQEDLLTLQYVGTYYSEWTCGPGGFDYLIGGNRSIFDELKTSAGKYLVLQLGRRKS